MMRPIVGLQLHADFVIRFQHIGFRVPMLLDLHIYVFPYLEQQRGWSISHQTCDGRKVGGSRDLRRRLGESREDGAHDRPRWGKESEICVRLQGC